MHDLCRMTAVHYCLQRTQGAPAALSCFAYGNSEIPMVNECLLKKGSGEDS
jgi:hypothetical protein